jgi:two-component system, NarL family, sensor histidine kinase UhpB
MPAAKRTFLVIILLSFHISYSQTRAIDSLQNIINLRNNDSTTLNALNSIATEYSRIDIAKAKTYLHQSIDLATSLKRNNGLSNSYSQMVTAQMNTGSKDSAEYYLHQLKSLAERESSELIKSSFNLAAGLFYKKQSKYKEALPYLLEGLKNNIKIDEQHKTKNTKTAVAGQYLNIGNIYSDLGNYREAIEYHLTGLKMFESLGNKRGISFCSQSIGMDFYNLKRYKEAIPYVAQSLELKKELNDKRGVASAHSLFGEITNALGQWDKAIIYFKEALKSFHELKLISDEAKSNMELGKINVLKKNKSEANQYFETAKTLAVQAKDSSLLVSIDAAKAAMESSVSEEPKKEEKFKISLQSATKAGDKVNEFINYQYLIDYYIKSKQFEKALDYTTKLYQAKDSVLNKNLELQIKQLEQQYNFEKKEKEITLLKKDQQLNALALSRQRAIQIGIIASVIALLIIAALAINRYRVLNETKRQLEIEKMRNALARDLHDDIGSALSSISIMSQLAGSSFLYGERIREQSSRIQESMSDIVWSINPMNDSLEKVVMKMKEFAAETLEPKNINYQFNVDETLNGDQLNIEKRKNVFLIFKEAVNNAAKYSQANEVKIDLSMNDHVLNLTIVDNGKGFDATHEKPGNGLKNMKARAEGIQGKLVIQSSVGNGTSVMLQVAIT